ncbi:class I SAM-dependent methyltransferase [Streptococcus sp. CSL10205-OR2]|uniref:class I SAM-dependent methyltransferase n=1 Tax=Streptococcus sp. CSL10205-OR2 TaxID=2980558 RepID=UPI0021D97EBF|nr:class I SAM-dependent methyltransferase [Streptococcus sp. CSL10205-OR2]MCU9532940.1 class I SAM-dependent methyltransferase [Streptococcus sp. CSL10205-OR2]
MKINLTGVMETMLITLDVRARDYHSDNSILNDKKSAEMIEKIDYDFSKLENDMKNYYGILSRAKVMDDEISKFIKQYPTCHIVSIGSGLDTRFNRLDNGKIHWYDLDFPDVIAIRKQFFEESDRVTFIPKSATDPSWVDEIHPNGEKLLIISEGVIMYFKPEEVKFFLNLLTDHFDEFVLHLDCTPKAVVKKAHMNKAVKKTNAQYFFGITNGKEITELNPKLKQIGYINFTDEFKKWLPGLKKLLIPIIYLFNNRLAMFTYKKKY